MRKGLIEDTGYEQPSVHSVLYCFSVYLTFSRTFYSFVNLSLFFVQRLENIDDQDYTHNLTFPETVNLTVGLKS